jgi:hypothetical protein
VASQTAITKMVIAVCVHAVDFDCDAGGITWKVLEQVHEFPAIALVVVSPVSGQDLPSRRR